MTFESWMKRAVVGLVLAAAPAAAAAPAGKCAGLPTQAELKAALTAARGASNGGFNLDMWGTVVNRDGAVCAVAFTGKARADQWPGSRVISAQKAYTANAFSLTGLALATANLYTAVQPGGSLFGLQHSNPVDTAVAYAGPAERFGQVNDPLVGKVAGGVNVFGGGLGLYDAKGVLVGGIGVSGDSSCADHAIAWRTRNALKLDFIPGGVGRARLTRSASRGLGRSLTASRRRPRMPWSRGSRRLGRWRGSRFAEWWTCAGFPVSWRSVGVVSVSRNSNSVSLRTSPADG
jgi:uncharacterized protein GlcG (DUF336 family)